MQQQREWKNTRTVEHVPQLLKETVEMVRPATPAPMTEDVAPALVATFDEPIAAVGHVTPTAPLPVITCEADEIREIDDIARCLKDLKKTGQRSPNGSHPREQTGDEPRCH